MSIDKSALVIIDDKGVDISSTHNDDGAISDKKKQCQVSFTLKTIKGVLCVQQQS